MYFNYFHFIVEETEAQRSGMHTVPKATQQVRDRADIRAQAQEYMLTTLYHLFLYLSYTVMNKNQSQISAVLQL